MRRNQVHSFSSIESLKARIRNLKGSEINLRQRRKELEKELERLLSLKR